MRYYLYRMPVQPTDDNSPVGMNDLLGSGEYASPKNAMRYLRPKRDISRCVNDSQPTLWLGLYVSVPHRDFKLVHKEKL